jgi:hypothetical protein
MFNRGQNERKSLLASSLYPLNFRVYTYIHTYVYIYRSLLSFYLKRTGEKEWKQIFSHNTKKKRERERVSKKKENYMERSKIIYRGIIFLKSYTIDIHT